MTALNIGFTSCTATDTWSCDRFIFMSIYIWRTNLNFFFWWCSFIYGGRISTSSDGGLTKPLRWYIRFFLGGDNMLVRSIRTYHTMVVHLRNLLKKNCYWTYIWVVSSSKMVGTNFSTHWHFEVSYIVQHFCPCLHAFLWPRTVPAKYPNMIFPHPSKNKKDR